MSGFHEVVGPDISEARCTARERRDRQPRSWAVRKFMVVVTLGIMGYAAHVYAGRFSEMRGIADARRPIGLLVPWCLLYLWMLWAYIKAILTPPGSACDEPHRFLYVPETPQALFPLTRWEDGDPYREAALADIESERIGEQVSGSHADVDPAVPPSAAHVIGTAPATATNGDAAALGKAPFTTRTPRGRFPPTTAPLLPPNRWCSRCTIVKPYRAHHCRVCGTACPVALPLYSPPDPEDVNAGCLVHPQIRPPLSLDWQCVGARNHKFFVNFSAATFLFTGYTFATLLALNVMNGAIDPQEVVIIALAALFALFTATLGAAHMRMLVHSQTTVESLGMQRLKERESSALAASDGPMGPISHTGTPQGPQRPYCPIGEAPRARGVRRGVDAEGNLWWAGSARTGWEDIDVKGKSVWGWVFPVDAPLGDGLGYRLNLRFDADGRWRRRER
ncbi:hypothetical protein GGX14DRAFT_574773 [Mycena pura]|uniref:Protein S-acyltransferase n=1 Tax=Mycena pura TaxID=153505 RepID=A0AAD6V0W2_9AGAR|nr:hypothetical protein GGX14DRAFT_574773 [Mycena pura]